MTVTSYPTQVADHQEMHQGFTAEVVHEQATLFTCQNMSHQHGNKVENSLFCSDQTHVLSGKTRWQPEGFSMIAKNVSNQYFFWHSSYARKGG